MSTRRHHKAIKEIYTQGCQFSNEKYQLAALFSCAISVILSTVMTSTIVDMANSPHQRPCAWRPKVEKVKRNKHS